MPATVAEGKTRGTLKAKSSTLGAACGVSATPNRCPNSCAKNCTSPSLTV